MLRDDVSVALHDACGNTDIFGIRAVVEKQIFAEILQALPAEKAFFAGRGISGYDALSHAESADVLPYRDHIASQLVPEHSGGYDHAGVIPRSEEHTSELQSLRH